MSLDLANGQVATSATAVFTATQTDLVTIIYRNTSASLTETLETTVLVNGGTARKLPRLSLAPDCSARLANIPVEDGDIIKAVTTDATTVDYLVYGCGTNGQGVLPNFAPFSLTSFDATGAQQASATATSQSINGTLTVTSASASALTVGRQGATNPVLKVDASTASVADGLQVKGAAAGSGVALLAITSGTNTPLTVDAAGSGLIAIGDTSTGQTYLGRGSLKATHQGLTLTALGTVQSSTPTAAQLLGGLLTQTGSTGAGTVTLPTGTALSAACSRTPIVGDSFEVFFMNVGGSQTLTITGATGTTVSGTAAVASGTPALLKFYCTGANAWNIYCLANA